MVYGRDWLLVECELLFVGTSGIPSYFGPSCPEGLVRQRAGSRRTEISISFAFRTSSSQNNAWHIEGVPKTYVKLEKNCLESSHQTLVPRRTSSKSHMAVLTHQESSINVWVRSSLLLGRSPCQCETSLHLSPTGLFHPLWNNEGINTQNLANSLPHKAGNSIFTSYQMKRDVGNYRKCLLGAFTPSA